MKYLYVSILLVCCFVQSHAQKTYSEKFEYDHRTATTNRPKTYSKSITPPPNYYITGISYGTNAAPTCPWCYPDRPYIDAFGFSGRYSVKCDGGPCFITYTVSYKEFFVDNNIVKISKDDGENLSSMIWGENKGGTQLQLVYKVESFNPTSKQYETKFASVTMPPFNKVRIVPRYKKIDVSLYEEFLTPMYTK